MGAMDFSHVSAGNTAQEAFQNARSQAQYDYGHAGYTGTIAEKHSFTVIPVPEGEDPYKFAQRLMDDGDERIDDKWGPAGCIKLDGDEYLFFGWASS